MSIHGTWREKMRAASWILVLGIIFSVSFSPDRFIREGALTDDEASYFSHAATIGLDFDLEYGNEIVTAFNCDRTIASHPVGAGLLAAPFVALFGMADRLTGHPVISDRSRYANSWAFFGFVLAANIYLLAGILLYFDAFAAIFPRLRLSHIALFVFSTGVVHYALYACFMSHAFEFAALAFTVWCCARLYRALCKNQATALWHLAAALSAVLNVLIRYSSLNVLFLPLTLVMLAALFDAEEKRPDTRQLAGLIPRQALFLVLAAVPAVIFFLIAYDQFFPTRGVLYCNGEGATGAAGLKADVMKVIAMLPNLPTLIFGSELGLLYSSPCLVLGFAAIIAALCGNRSGDRTAARIAAMVLVVLYYAFSVSIVLAWQTVASAYGYRYLFPLVPLGMFGAALWVDRMRGDSQAGGRRSLFRRGLTVVLFGLCLYATAGQVFTETTPKLTPRKQVNVYGVMTDRSYRGVSFALPGEILKPKTWASLVANRYPGFIGSALVLYGPLRERVPPRVAENVARAYGGVSRQAYIQGTGLFLLWLSAGVCFYCVQRRRDLEGKGRKMAGEEH